MTSLPSQMPTPESPLRKAAEAAERRRISGHSLAVLENFQRRQTAVRAHDAAAWVGGRSAHVEILNRRPILRPSRNRPQEEELLQRKLTLEDVAFAQSPLALQIERC